MSLGSMILGRLLGTVPVLLGVVTVVFFTIRMAPGDPAEMMVGFYGDEAKVAEVRAQMGLDRPMLEQFWRFLSGAVRGDLGLSLRSNQPVAAELARAFVPTLQLASASMLIAILVGVPLGVASALRPGSIVDHVAMGFAVVGIAVPVFWTGMLLMLVVGYYLNLLPPAGYGNWRYLVLPAVALSGNALAFTARLVRTELLDALGQDYIRTAKAKGIREVVLVTKHALRNAALPAVTAIGIRFGELLGGAVLVETVFAWPGLGSLLSNAIVARDYTLIQGSALLIALGFVLINLMVDLLYTVINPTLQD